MMKSSFFARPLPLFGSVAVLVLCVIFFGVPFALRGARMSLERMENNVKDWLPEDFPETRELEWFGRHFVGERFVLMTWPGCNRDDTRFQLMVKKLQHDLAPEDPEEELAEAIARAGDDPDQQAAAVERVKARQLADRLLLFRPGSQYDDWSGEGEKWLLGEYDQWYYVTRDGQLYRWAGRPNAPGFLWRSLERLLTGKNQLEGELVATFGEPAYPGKPNEFHNDPRKLTARLFRTLTTGPDVVERLTAEGGPLWPVGQNIAEERKPLVAHRQAYDRLTGILFGPAVQPGFSWEPDDFYAALPEDTQSALPPDWRTTFTHFVDRLVRDHYHGDREKLKAASAQRQTHYWDLLFERLGVLPPARPTCLVLTLSEAGKRDMRRVIGRPILGKPMGKLYDLAVNECNLALDTVKLGGPPVDNVAIDEEGTITLFRLIGYSAMLGIGLSWLCFRSVKVTTMVFFVGGVSAVASLSVVWWCGASVDAILMSMPSLVYVLGLSGAVHIVNYYKEAVRSDGLAGAPERALRHGAGPCALAAFTTSLGLLSLYASNLAPIKKFGLFSAIGVMATLGLLFLYLPAALTVWPPKRFGEGHEKQHSVGDRITAWITHFWTTVGKWIVRRNKLVTVGCFVVLLGFATGLPRLNTSVQLLKLFDKDAKIIRDYRWLEQHVGKLVPMELVIRISPDRLRPPLDELGEADDEARKKARYQLSFLERLELVQRIQDAVQAEFGENGQGIVGQGMSAVTFTPDLPAPDNSMVALTFRNTFNSVLESHREELLAQDYLRVDEDPGFEGSELWRISLRLGALNDVDYGQFVHEQKLVVEPVLNAYRYFYQMVHQLDNQSDSPKPWARVRLGVLGAPKPPLELADESVAEEVHQAMAGGSASNHSIDQLRIFTTTFRDLLLCSRFPAAHWHDPVASPLPPDFARSDAWARQLESLDCVILVRDDPSYDLAFIREHAKLLIDARKFQFQLGMTPTAAERGDSIQVVYTGVVPVVYKAQRTLLNSLIESIALAFVMIAVVMMVLLRDWRSKWRPANTVNLTAGMISMLPNVFPVVIVFGAMGHLHVLVDIGTMMCASVAIGVAVDDTIHYLTWFRHGIRTGLSRQDAIVEAYRRVGTAMTQTTLIGGLGLAVFALSTFTPTQRFGIMMVTILAMALVGDLVFLPALLAGPLGRAFCPRVQPEPSSPVDALPADSQLEPAAVAEVDTVAAAADAPSPDPSNTAHSRQLPTERGRMRRDPGHRWPRPKSDSSD